MEVMNDFITSNQERMNAYLSEIATDPLHDGNDVDAVPFSDLNEFAEETPEVRYVRSGLGTPLTTKDARPHRVHTFDTDDLFRIHRVLANLLPKLKKRWLHSLANAVTTKCKEQAPKSGFLQVRSPEEQQELRKRRGESKSLPPKSNVPPLSTTIPATVTSSSSSSSVVAASAPKGSATKSEALARARARPLPSRRTQPRRGSSGTGSHLGGGCYSAVALCVTRTLTVRDPSLQDLW